MEKSLLGCGVGVAESQKRYACAPRPPAVVGHEAGYFPDARRRVAQRTGNSVALRNSVEWNMRWMHVKVSRFVCRCRASGQTRQGWLRAAFQSVVPGESRQTGASTAWALLCEEVAGGGATSVQM
jgi:hypothetical protein